MFYFRLLPSHHRQRTCTCFTLDLHLSVTDNIPVSVSLYTFTYRSQTTYPCLFHSRLSPIYHRQRTCTCFTPDLHPGIRDDRHTCARCTKSAGLHRVQVQRKAVKKWGACFDSLSDCVSLCFVFVLARAGLAYDA